METALILEILKIAVVNGVPAVTSVIESMKKKTITVEDVKVIQELVQKPEKYFK